MMDVIASLPVTRMPSSACPSATASAFNHVQVFLFTSRAEYNYIIASQSGPRWLFALAEIYFSGAKWNYE